MIESKRFMEYAVLVFFDILYVFVSVSSYWLVWLSFAQGETEMAIQDRVAFACTYLSDVRLMEYLEKLKARLTEEGNLDGVLLTG